MKIMQPLRRKPGKLLATIAMFFAHLSVQAAECEPWTAKLVSVQGVVESRGASASSWRTAGLNDTFCPGDSVRTGTRSRAAVFLADHTVLRLGQNTTITLGTVSEGESSWLELLEGIVHFFSRVPRSLDVRTPFVNAGIEGTEFVVEVAPDRAVVTVFEGTVAASNPQGRVLVQSGESVVATKGLAPVARTVVALRDTVHWALYYPPIVDLRAPASWSTGNAWKSKARESLQRYRSGDLAGAFASLAGIQPTRIDDPSFFVYRAALLLTVGRADEADQDIDRALALDPQNAAAMALRSIVILTQGDREVALDRATKAVNLDPASSTARIALSYAQQADFAIRSARETMERVVADDPDNALAWARLSEFWQSEGYLDRSLSAAERAAALNPDLARTQTVLGFAYLTEIKTRDARFAFERAIMLDQADPLPRLGLGLAVIRDGMLQEGRRQIEIAAGLDPNNSLIRSYLGKAYFDENRNQLAESQFEIAKALDPLDPTPHFYDAVRKQTENRPVEALEDLQTSIRLNNNRAVFRSRLLLDEDLAARSAALGRIYSDLGFEQLALVEGLKSINEDPSNHSPHRLLADSYAARPRHEIARVSELLQSQLLQPLNVTPLQPQLAEASLLGLEGAGPASASFNEFNPLFMRDQFALQASGVLGNMDTYGGELVHSAIQQRFAYSVGAYGFQTDGFRDNSDYERTILNAFGQYILSPRTSLQAEARSSRFESGDVTLRFERDNVIPNFRRDIDTDSIRLGLRHGFSPSSDLIASLIYVERDDTQSFFESDPPFDIASVTEERSEGIFAELQHILRRDRLNGVSGISYFDQDLVLDDLFEVTEGNFPILSDSFVIDDDISKYTIYTYWNLDLSKDFTWTLGASYDKEDSDVGGERDQFNPKVGVTWNPVATTTVRAAAFRVLRRPTIVDQTIEPTQVAGFNQFFDDPARSDAKRYGAALDQKFSDTLYGGVELTTRDITVPVTGIGLGLDRDEEQDEQLHRLYSYWTPTRRVSVSLEYLFEKFERDFLEGFSNPTNPVLIETHYVPLGLRFFHPSGFYAGVTGTYVNQDVGFSTEIGTETDNDSFWIADLVAGYRLPKRRGILTISVKNLFDEDFSFQDTNLAGEPRLPIIQPDRAIIGKVTLSF